MEHDIPNLFSDAHWILPIAHKPLFIQMRTPCFPRTLLRWSDLRLVLTCARAYDCPCFYQRLASARLSAPSRYRASESEAGAESEEITK